MHIAHVVNTVVLLLCLYGFVWQKNGKFWIYFSPITALNAILCSYVFVSNPIVSGILVVFGVVLFLLSIGILARHLYINRNKS